MTHVRIWKFRPSPSRVEEFQRAYSAGGPWARLFAKAPGYQGTELLRPMTPGGWWITLDRWDSERSFAKFQAEYGNQYRNLDQQLEGVVGEEEYIGAFDVSG